MYKEERTLIVTQKERVRRGVGKGKVALTSTLNVKRDGHYWTTAVSTLMPIVRNNYYIIST
jgi:hypothetical protein